VEEKQKKHKKLSKRKPVKYEVGTVDHILTVLSSKGKKLILAEMKRRRPSQLTYEVVALKKNPNKVVFSRLGHIPECLEVFSYYIDKEKDIRGECGFIARGNNFIRLHESEIDAVIEGLQKLKSWLQGK